MQMRLLSLFVRACLGILLILNGPANALAMGFVSIQKQGCKKCCGGCATSVPAKTMAKNAPPKDDSIRPTCPLCPSCPNFPGGCCVSCPCKVPFAPPLVFVIPESPDLVWQLANDDISCSDSHSDEPILPPRFAQFVAITV